MFPAPPDGWITTRGAGIRGSWPATTDETGNWNAFEAWYANRTQPYMALAECGSDPASVKHFVENYGPIGKDLSGKPAMGSFGPAEFCAEAWRFRLSVGSWD